MQLAAWVPMFKQGSPPGKASLRHGLLGWNPPSPEQVNPQLQQLFRKHLTRLDTKDQRERKVSDPHLPMWQLRTDLAVSPTRIVPTAEPLTAPSHTLLGDLAKLLYLSLFPHLQMLLDLGWGYVAPNPLSWKYSKFEMHMQVEYPFCEMARAVLQISLALEVFAYI